MEMAAMLIIVFAIAIAAATFIENDFGTLVARRMVYNARWFELLMLLIAVNLLGSMVTKKLYRREKIHVFVFHSAIVVIFLGAAITRYTGFEGSMHIREGESGSILQTEGAAFQVWADDKEEPVIRHELSYKNLSRHEYRQSMEINGKKVEIAFTGFIPNAYETIHEDASGLPVAAMILLLPEGRQQVFVADGERFEVPGFSVSLNMENSDALLRLTYDGESLYMVSDSVVYLREMTSERDSLLENGTIHLFAGRTIYRIHDISFVLQSMYPAASLALVPMSSGQQPAGLDALQVRIVSEGMVHQVNLMGKNGIPGEKTEVPVGEHVLNVAYGAMRQKLPFSLYLRDFQLERYPGSNSPSSFASEVTLSDTSRGVEKDYRIFMNNILKYRGYRFYQSSYDRDEKGTVLSVNRDLWGTTVSYSGYFLLIAGMVLAFFVRGSRFRKLLSRSRDKGNSRLQGITALLFLLMVSSQGAAQTTERSQQVIAREQAREFGRLLVQDHHGRTKPLNTLAADVVHKLTRRDKFKGWHPMQVFIGMHHDPAGWQTVPMIRVADPELKNYLGVEGPYASFHDFVDFGAGQQYKLSEFVEKAYAKAPGARDRFDKEIIDVDERVNISYMIYTGQFLRIFPKEDDPAHTWYTPAQSAAFPGYEDSVFVAGIIDLYFHALDEGIQTGIWTNATDIIKYLHNYQQRKASIDLPGSFKITMEILYYEWNVFRHLYSFYGLFGLAFLLVLLANLIFPRIPVRRFNKIAFIHLLVAFIIHTAGLAVRWYISGHAPWSNGFESMIYVAWATMLAGLIFYRRSAITLAATSVLASLTLFVAHLSWMNPEITNLVPVLKSYWLTLHVSVITASYGFLGLAAVLGIIILLLFLFMTPGNHKRISGSISELTTVSEMAIQLGLLFITTGTLLGAIWANESWGRYWGWDPKETWSLVTIVVYTFISHMRQIPGLKTHYSFSLAAIVGFSSVLMTYFGVNYYLSGLHSYAQGDPVPVPAFVYYSLAALLLLAVFSGNNQRRFSLPQPLESSGG